MSSRMPKLPFDAMLKASGIADLNDSADTSVFGERVDRIFRACFNLKTGCIKSAKPFDSTHFYKDSIQFNSTGSSMYKACANYVWRMLCFDFCDFAPHVSMPVTADFDIMGVCSEIARRTKGNGRDYDMGEVTIMTKALREWIQRFEATVPVQLQKGVMRWGRAFGMV